MKFTKRLFIKKDKLEIVTIFLACVFSSAAYLWSFKHGYILAYNDSMAHLNIARFVFDSVQPGLVQLGTVWLPLSHILSLSLVWNYWAWQSGFAGSIFSMLSYVISVWVMYKIIKETTEKKYAAFVGAMVLALNLNFLYLQTTSLTEPLYICIFVYSIYIFVKWSNDNKLSRLLLLGFLGFLQIFTRYEGWFVVAMEGFLILIHIIFYKRSENYYKKINNAFGEMMLFMVPILFGFFVWIMYNWLIFGDPLAFAFGSGSAHAQQLEIENTYGLSTKFHIAISLRAYWFAVVDNIGRFVMPISIAGACIFLFKNDKRINLFSRGSFLLLLFSPIIFNIIALFLGFSTINIPFSTDYYNYQQVLFNVRYGIMALPLVAFAISVLINFEKKKIAIFGFVIILFVLFLQLGIDYKNNPISLSDGLFGLSSYARLGADVGATKVLKESVGKNEKVLVSTESFNSVLFKTGLPLKTYIYEGVYKEWDLALKNPEKYADWIAIRDGDRTDVALTQKDDSNFLQYYNLVYSQNNVRLYEIKKEDRPSIIYDNLK